MKALTVWQPWASIIIAGWKPYEWRDNNRAKAYAGQRIVIHAGARPMQRRELLDLLYRLEHGPTALLVRPCLELVDRILNEGAQLPLASGLGTVLLGRPRRATEIMAGVADSDRIDQHKWGWPMSDPRPFEPVVPARGFQGFWPWPYR